MLPQKVDISCPCVLHVVHLLHDTCNLKSSKKNGMLLCNLRIFFFKFEHRINYCSAPNAVLPYIETSICINIDAKINGRVDLARNFLGNFSVRQCILQIVSFQRLSMGSIRLGIRSRNFSIQVVQSMCDGLIWTVKWVFGRSSDLGPPDWFDWSPSFTSTDSQTELETVLQDGGPCSARVL